MTSEQIVKRLQERLNLSEADLAFVVETLDELVVQPIEYMEGLLDAAWVSPCEKCPDFSADYSTPESAGDSCSRQGDCGYGLYEIAVMLQADDRRMEAEGESEDGQAKELTPLPGV